MLPYFSAHRWLSSCRTINGSIPWTALSDYATRHPAFAEDFSFFEEVISGFDRVNEALSKMRRGTEDQPKPEKPKQQKPYDPKNRRRRR